ncbi:MAG: cytochrome c maturation protein CcmE [Schwartzia sp.]|nr:cytochrome c maturation protein CcmE [Schwartzia sp. (in: firmicutes)]
MRNKTYLLIGLVVLFIAYAGWTFADTLTPYVDIQAAKVSEKTVQVKGLLDKAAPPPVQEGDYFVFPLTDEQGGKMTVRYKGVKPDQFDEAYHIVAVGNFRDGAFFADRLLIKCPSKYETQKGKK